MKRLFVILMALVFMTVPVTAFAAVGKGDTQSIDVRAKYSDGTATPDVYSVDISWGKMEFTYSASGSHVWDPAKHLYTDNTSAVWTENGNTVTVTNHSNVSVTADFVYVQASGYEDISGTLDVTSRTLNAGVVNKPNEADGVTTKLTLSGTLPGNVTDFTKVGAITVSIK